MSHRPSLHPYENILDHLKNRALILTPNNRLSRELLVHFSAQSPELCVAKPPIYAYNELLRTLFKEIQQQVPKDEHPIVLSMIHLRKLWQKIISQTDTPPLTEGLLQALIKSWALCHEWHVNLRDPAFQQSPQHEQFSKWAIAIEVELQKLNAISEYHIAGYLQQYLPALRLPKTWVWFCFDDDTPAQSALKAQLTSLGYTIHQEDIYAKHTLTHQCSVEKMHDEYLQLHAWIKANLGQRLGIIVPTLEEEAQYLARFMHHMLADQEVNISFSQPLSSYPLVAHALTWLKLDLNTITSHQRQLIFSSTYLGGFPQEQYARAKWMQKSCFFVDETLDWSYFLRQLPSSFLKKSLQSLTPYPKKAPLSEWVSHFECRLKQLGFPGEAELDSTSYQCLQRLITLFEEFRTLQLLTETMTQQEAIQTIQELAEISTFQPERKPASIHILGLLEASGCIFDHLWVMHMTDQNFPQQGQCSAFIPLSIQKNLNMPHANHAREMQYARQIFGRLTAGSQTQVFSYARFNQDSPALPSPFLNHLPHHQNTMPPNNHTHQREKTTDNYDLPLAPDEKFGGGTTLLANQAKCPFRAFAAHRLRLQKENELSSGLNPKERGQIVHLVLEKLWHQLQSKEALMTIQETELHERIEKIIGHTLASFAEIHQTSFPALLQTLERERLLQLVVACLDFEKKRPNFQIAALEQDAEIVLAGLRFRVKLDRMDLLESGEKWVIDYKTSLPTQKPWNEERPEEPQLLLYALLDESIHGMMFIELRHGKIQCAGFTDGEPISGMQHCKNNEPWETHQARWHNQLSMLAEEFKAGHCYPTPTRSSLCSTCEFKPLCRVS